MRTPFTRAAQRQSGRALPLVLILAAVGLLAFLFIADPLGLMSSTTDEDPYADGTDGALLGTQDDTTEEAAEDLGTANLAALYGDGDRGAIALRLRWVKDNSPVEGQAVLLRHRRGDDVATIMSDANGKVTFPKIAPDRAYSLHLKGEGFKAVSIYGIKVLKGKTYDAGTQYLGDKIVLRGRVTTLNGSPIPNANVTAESGAADTRPTGIVLRMTRMAMNDAPPLDAATSDDDGYFMLSKLDDGRYRLTARHGGYATDYEDDVIVRADRTANELVLRLGKAGAIKGVVRDSSGKAVPGAQVWAVADTGWRGMMSGAGMRRETAVTDGQGRYEIDTLTPSTEQNRVRYRLGVIADGYAPVFESASLEVEEGETQVKDFVVPQGGTIEGIVTDKDTGKPVANAEVAALIGRVMMGRGGRRGGNNAEPQQGTAVMAKTDEEGRFRFENVVPGPVLSAQVEAYGYVTGNFSNQWGQTNGWPDIEANEVIEVNAELERGGVVQGRVTDGEGQGIPGATVTVESMRSFFTGAPSAYTDEKGDFELAGVSPGNYTLRATLEGYAPAAEDGTVQIEMPEAGGLVKSDLSLVQAGTVVGIVTDAAGEPVPGVRLRVTQVAEEGDQNNNRNGMRGRMNRWRESMRSPLDMSDAEGKFRLAGIQAGRWKITGTSEGYVRSESKPFRIAVGEELTVNFAMQAGGILRVKVTGEGGRALEGATVRTMYLDDPNRRVSAWEMGRWGRGGGGGGRMQVDESGVAVIEDLQPGSTVVQVEAEGYVTKIRRNITVVADQEVILPMALTQGETVTGVVLDSEGKPLARAWVRVTSERDPSRNWGGNNDDNEPQSDEIEPIYSGRTDENGRFEVPNVPRGTYSVYVGGARGHVGWLGQGNDAEAQNAIKRAVSVPGSELSFNLAKSPEGAGGGFGGGGRRGR